MTTKILHKSIFHMDKNSIISNFDGFEVDVSFQNDDFLFGHPKYGFPNQEKVCKFIDNVLENKKIVVFDIKENKFNIKFLKYLKEKRKYCNQIWLTSRFIDILNLYRENIKYDNIKTIIPLDLFSQNVSPIINLIKEYNIDGIGLLNYLSFELNKEIIEEFKNNKILIGSYGIKENELEKIDKNLNFTIIDL